MSIRVLSLASLALWARPKDSISLESSSKDCDIFQICKRIINLKCIPHNWGSYRISSRTPSKNVFSQPSQLSRETFCFRTKWGTSTTTYPHQPSSFLTWIRTKLTAHHLAARHSKSFLRGWSMYFSRTTSLRSYQQTSKASSESGLKISWWSRRSTSCFMASSTQKSKSKEWLLTFRHRILLKKCTLAI